LQALSTASLTVSVVPSLAGIEHGLADRERRTIPLSEYQITGDRTHNQPARGASKQSGEIGQRRGGSDNRALLRDVHVLD
jgi:hypothetical protein